MNPNYANVIIDLSHNNGSVVSFHEVAASGIQLALNKTSEGTYFSDPIFGSNVSRETECGIIPGAYHFLSPGYAKMQSQYFTSSIGRAHGKPIVLMLDCERGIHGTPNQLDIEEFLAALFDSTGVYPILYGSPGVLASIIIRPSSIIANTRLMAAKYSDQEPALPGILAEIWPDGWSIWQYSQTGTVPGINGSVDRSVFRRPSGLAEWVKTYTWH